MVDNISFIKCYIDRSHQIHDNCMGRMGALMMLGKGAVSSPSRKQRLDARSSTEMELMAVNDKLPDVSWTRYFIEAQ